MFGAALAWPVALLRAVPLWAWALSLLLAWGGWQKHRATVATQAAEQAQATAALATATEQAQARERELEHAFATNARKAADVYARNQARERAAAAAAAAELGSLRDAIDGAPVSAACTHPGAASSPDVAGTYRELFGSCAAALQSLAAEADRVEGKLTALQDHVRATQPGPAK